MKQDSQSNDSSKQRATWHALTRIPAAAGIALLLCQPVAHALNFGELVLESGYGQPLRATLPVSIRRGEVLTTGCISHVTDNTEAGFARLKDLTITIPSAGVPGIYMVSISSPYRLTEPMYDLRLQINCTGSSNFIRSFTLIPEVKQSGTVITAPPQKTSLQPEAVETIAPAAQVPVTNAGPLAANSLYRVEGTDSLSSIAARITPAWGSLKRRGKALLLENPEAFVDGDPQRIKAGSLILIPAGMPTTRAEDLSIVSAQTGGDSGTLPPTGTDSPTAGGDTSLVAPTSSMALNAAPAAATAAASLSATQANVTQASATTEAEPDAQVRDMAAAYAKAREVAEVAAKNARAEEMAAITAEADTIAEPKRRSGNLLLAVIVGGLIGTIISLLIMGRRMLATKRKLRQPVIDPETAPRYANDDDFIAPVAAEHNFEDTFVVDEDEDAFRKTIASDEHASRLMARMEDANKASRAAGNETSDKLPRSAVNSSFLDSDPDLFDHASQHSEPSHERDTLQDIFNEALFTDQEDPDAPAEKRVQAAKHATENVQRLAKTAEDQDDENLSATLVDALHLLEQEYQEELTASQVLDPEEVQKSLGRKQKL